MCSCKRLYFAIAPSITLGTTMLGIFTSVTMEVNSFDKPKHKHTGTFFMNIIAGGTIGAVSGMTFPISFPLITVYVLNAKC
jgi:hypothetical protein